MGRTFGDLPAFRDDLEAPRVYPDPSVTIGCVEHFLKHNEAVLRAGTLPRNHQLYSQGSTLYRQLNVAGKLLVSWHHRHGTVAYDLVPIRPLLERLSALLDESGILLTNEQISRAGRFSPSKDDSQLVRIQRYWFGRSEKRRFSTGPVREDDKGRPNNFIDVLHVRFRTENGSKRRALGWVAPGFSLDRHLELASSHDRSERMLGLSHEWTGHDAHAQAITASTIAFGSQLPSDGSITFVATSSARKSGTLPAPSFSPSDHEWISFNPGDRDFHKRMRDVRGYFEAWIEKELTNDRSELPKVLRGGRPVDH